MDEGRTLRVEGARAAGGHRGPWGAGLLCGMLLLAACDGGGGPYADGREVLERAGVCEGEIERTEAEQDLWRCASADTADTAEHIMADVSEDPDSLRAGLRLLLDLDETATMVLGEDWSIVGLRPEDVAEVAEITGGRVIDDVEDLDLDG